MDNAMFTKAGIVTLNQVNIYNGNGQRVEKSENGQSSNYYYQNGSVLYTTGKADKSTELEEPDNTEILTGVTSLNLMGTSENTIATVRDIIGNETYYFYNKDMRESTTNLVDVEGKSVVSYEYTDFGETQIKGDENFYNEIGYTGGIYDNKTGLYYLNARYYNPEDGRFLTEDTYRGEYSDPSSLNLYAYCVNNPIAYTDPSGHIPVWGIINAGFGALDGYNHAKKKNLKGIKKVGAIVGGAVVGVVNPFKKVKVVKVTKKVKKVAKKAKSTKVVAKRVSKVVKKSNKSKSSSVKISKKVTKSSSKKNVSSSKKSTKKYRKGNRKISQKSKVSKYVDITERGSLVKNRATNVSKAKFGKNLEADGWKKTVAKDGKAVIYQKNGAKYVLRDDARSTGGPTADFYKSGSKRADIKIRLGEK